MSVGAGFGAAMSDGEFRQLLEKLDGKLKDVDAASLRMFNCCNRALAILPPGMATALHRSLTLLRNLMVSMTEHMAKIILNPGWPPGLLAAAAEWTSKVGGPASALSGTLGTDQLRVDNHWKGPAAEAYAATLPAQQKALDGIKQTADVLDANLTHAAYGIVALWVGVVGAIVMYAVELTGEGAAAATVVGAPPAAAAAAASTAKVIALIVAGVGLFATYAGLVADSLSSMRQSIHANGPFPGGEWPRSTTSDFSDGSLTDGDTTDWRIKTND